MGLLDIFNYGTGGSYYDDRQKEIEKRENQIGEIKLIVQILVESL